MRKIFIPAIIPLSGVPIGVMESGATPAATNLSRTATALAWPGKGLQNRA